MDSDKKISRKEFLSVLGGAMAVALLSKFIDTNHAVATVVRSKRSIGYGGSTYGGKKA